MAIFDLACQAFLTPILILNFVSDGKQLTYAHGHCVVVAIGTAVATHAKHKPRRCARRRLTPLDPSFRCTQDFCSGQT